MHRSFIGGEGIHAGEKSFVTGHDLRSDAEWREALEELVAKNLIAARSKSLYEVTAAGFRTAEELSADKSCVDSSLTLRSDGMTTSSCM